jgi:hypothetical protein
MIGPAPTVHLLGHQQRVQVWLDHLGAVLRQRGLVPGRVGSVELDWFDGLRSPLNYDGAAALVGEPPRSFPSLRVLGYRVARELEQLARLHRRPRLVRVPGTVLVLPRLNGRHVVGIARALRETHGHRVMFLRTPLDAAGAEHEFPALLLQDFGGIRSRVVVVDVLRLLRQVSRVLDRLEVPGFTVEETRRLAQVTRGSMARDMTIVWRTAFGIDTVLRESGASLLMVGNPCTIEGRVAALIARRHGVAVAGVEYGTVFAGDPRWRDCPVDLMCAWGEPGRDAFLANGLPRERVVITGSALQDENVARKTSVEAAEPPQVLVATSGAGDKVTLPEHLRFIAVASEAVRKSPDVRWVFKLHRKDSVAHYGDLGKLPNVEIVSADKSRFGADIYDQLARARLLVTVQSTSAVDAMVMDVPVISVDVDRLNRDRGAEFLQHTRIVHDADELLASLREVLSGVSHPTEVSARSYVRRHFHHPGAASQAAAAALERLSAAAAELPR